MYRLKILRTPKSILGRGGFRARDADATSSGIRPPADPKGPSFGTF